MPAINPETEQTQTQSGKLIAEVKHLNKVFNVSGQDVHIVKDANLKIHFGELILILGPSGSGKSTLVNTILGLDPVTTGEIFFLDNPIHKGTEDGLAEFRKNHIGIIYQQSIWVKALNVIENVAFPLSLRGITQEKAKEKAYESLKKIGMEKWAYYSPVELSSGQQQKVALARCLISEPQVIVADEPTGNLDFKSGVELMTIMAEQVKQGRTVVMITHDLNNINYATRIVRIFDGRIVEEIDLRGKDPEDVKTDLVKRKIYERNEEENSVDDPMQAIKVKLDTFAPQKDKQLSRWRAAIKATRRLFTLKFYKQLFSLLLTAVAQTYYAIVMSIIIGVWLVIKSFEAIIHLLRIQKVLPRIDDWIARGHELLESRSGRYHFTISYHDLLYISLKNIMHKKTRSFVTIGGISIGIGFTVFLTALGYGLESLVVSRIATLDQLKQFDVFAQPATFLQLNKETLEEIRRFPNVTDVMPVIGSAGRVFYANSTSEVVVYAVQSDYLKYSSIPLVAGNYFDANQLEVTEDVFANDPNAKPEDTSANQQDPLLDQQEVDQDDDSTPVEKGVVTTYIPQNAVRQMVVNQVFIDLLGVTREQVLGEGVEIAFTATDEVLSGETSELRTYPTKYEIVGIANVDTTPVVYIPVVDMRSIGIENYSQVRVRVNDQAEMRGIRNQLSLSGYETSSLLDTINEVERLFVTVRTVVAGIGLVALLVAAFGMFNTLTVSLLERTKEIGLMKSIGMKSYEVKNMFLIEAIIIGVIGGIGGIIIGLIAGVAISLIISLVAVSRGFEYIQLTSLPISVGFAILIVTIITGIFTGFYPSLRATKISPINALRYE